MNGTESVTIPLVLPPEVESKLKAEIEATLRSENTIAVAKLQDEMRQTNDVALKKAVTDFEIAERAKRTPLTADDIQKLLSKEYTTFELQIQAEDDEGTEPIIHKFKLRELPQNIEREFYTITKETMSKMIGESGSLDFDDISGDIFEKLVGLMDLYSPIQDTLATCCVICLNPKKKLSWLTLEWVKNNLNNYRMLTILMAQVEVNKMRDFFSMLFQNIKGIDQ